MPPNTNINSPKGTYCLTLYYDRDRKKDLHLAADLMELTLGDHYTLYSVSGEFPPTLQYLKILSCHELEDLPKFPASLRSLQIDRCHKLNQLPPLPATLRRLEVSESFLEQLPALPSALQSLQLKHCYKLKELPALPADLESLIVESCSKLQELPAVPTSLRILIVKVCQSLKQLPPLHFGLSELFVSPELYVSHGIDRLKQEIWKETLVRSLFFVKNVEMRRKLIQDYGWSEFMLDSGAEEIHRDSFGVLYKLELNYDHPLMMVRVMNSTAEEDGSFKYYCLMVDPWLRPMLIDDETGAHYFGSPQKPTARNAVASTFGLRGEEFCPEIET